MEKTLLINEDYLGLPICVGKTEQLIEIFEVQTEGLTKVMEWMVPVCEEEGADYAYDYKASIPVKAWKGKKLVLKGEVSETFWKEVENTSFFRISKNTEENRPSIHFTASTGWINDPNGLVYADGAYHLYYQYNPCNTSWQNMSWGHAVSSDLLHWEEKEMEIVPDEHGMMFSGCGLKNEQGLLDLPKEALLFFYTAAGDNKPWGKERHFTQRIAYSLEQGQNLTKLSEPYLEEISEENRDPKIFWHEESKAYIMVLWLEGNDFAIFRSVDLKDWQMSDRLTLKDAWECPDLMKLYDEEGNAHWLFWSADGFYFWGDFDGYTFKTDGKKHLAYMNKLPYAAQTYSGVEGRTISIPWLRTKNRGTLYTGAMGLPRELGVKVINGEKYLVQKPVRELMMQRQRIAQKEQLDLRHNAFNYNKGILTNKKNQAVQIEMQLEEKYNHIIKWKLNGTEVSYNPQNGIFSVNDETYDIGKDRKYFSFLIDSNIFEVNVDHDIMTGIFDLEDHCMEIWGDMKGIKQFVVYEIL